MNKPAEALEGTTQMENVFSEREARRARANIIGSEMLRLANERSDIVVLSADMGATVGELREAHPERYFEFGISETNTMSSAAGMAACGLRPFVMAMAPFCMIKCGEQIRTDIAYNKLPVRIMGRLSGLAMGFFGTSHHDVEDIAISRVITNMTAVSPADGNATLGLIRSTLDLDGPVYIRVSEGITREVYQDVPDFAFGRFNEVHPGSDLCVIATGLPVSSALTAAEKLASEGTHVQVLDATYLKPLDEEAIVSAAEKAGRVLTIEEHNVVGGLGTAVAEVLARHRVNAEIRIHGLPDVDLAAGVPAALIELYRLDADGVEDEIRSYLKA